jgi:hypothetical protein
VVKTARRVQNGIKFRSKTVKSDQTDSSFVLPILPKDEKTALALAPRGFSRLRGAKSVRFCPPVYTKVNAIQFATKGYKPRRQRRLSPLPGRKRGRPPFPGDLGRRAPSGFGDRTAPSIAALATSLRLAFAPESVIWLPQITPADSRHSPCRPRTEFSGRTTPLRPPKAAPHGAICIQIVFSSVYW